MDGLVFLSIVGRPILRAGSGLSLRIATISNLRGSWSTGTVRIWEGMTATCKTIGYSTFSQFTGGSAPYAHHWVRQGVPWSESPKGRVRSPVVAEVGGRTTIFSSIALPIRVQCPTTPPRPLNVIVCFQIQVQVRDLGVGLRLCMQLELFMGLYLPREA